MIPIKCICGERPTIGHTASGKSWVIVCRCGEGFGCGTSRFSAIRSWNRQMRNKKKVRGLENE